ncbi:MAG: HAD family hydrolase [Candidatus Izimaplasma sp.]|nr:HAD family hydrolase [Candidatus Izimaplasma bacterium]
MIKNYLFDLDGTLLPLDEDIFIENYMKLIGKKFISLGYNPKTMIDRLWMGTKAMINNKGIDSNEAVFWETFYTDKTKISGLKKALEKFYENEFGETFKATKPSEYSRKIISLLQKRSKRIILATNPVFPLVATKQRIEWANLSVSDFEHITTYENSSFSKPNINYYKTIMNMFNLIPEETIMIGNDATEDMVAEELGLKTFLVTDCLKNKYDVDINNYQNGTLKELYELIKSNRL